MMAGVEGIRNRQKPIYPSSQDGQAMKEPGISNKRDFWSKKVRNHGI